MNDFESDLAELSAAEEFLDYFEIPYQQEVVHVNRLHILQRYHDYLLRGKDSLPEGEAPLRAAHRALLERAYQDFVDSTPLDERVFKVLKNAVGQGFVPLSLVGGVSDGDAS